MRRLLVLTSALALIACNDVPFEPRRTPATPEVETGGRILSEITNVTWTQSTTGVAMIVLGKFGTREVFPTSINNAGQVVGYFDLDPDMSLLPRAVIWENGVYANLPRISGGAISYAYAISDAGVIVGYADIEGGQIRPVVWENRILRELPMPEGFESGDGEARSINAAGEIVGSFAGRAVKWLPSGEVILLPLLSGSDVGFGHGINASGTIVGLGAASDMSAQVPWIGNTDGVSAAPIPAGALLAGSFGPTGRVLNDAGDYLGRALNEDGVSYRGFVVRNGTVVTLPNHFTDVNSDDLFGLGINQGGDIVGQETIADGTPRAVAWRRGGRSFDLGTVTDHYRSHAVAVNDNLDRLAVGWSTSATVGRHAVIWKLPAGDDTPPVITASVQGTLGDNGWYRSDVQVSWTVTDAESPIPIQTGCEPITISADNAGVPLTCSATNAADLTATETVIVRRDATAPLIAYEGNAGSYTVDQTVAISCAASDAMSGIASNNCQSINADALSLGVGIHTRSATATDQAGNSASATATFTVNLTLGSIAQLTRRYSSHAQTGELLARLLIMAEHFRAHRNSLAAELALRAYMIGVEYQINKAFTEEEGERLIDLSKNFLETRASRQKPRGGHRGWR